MIVQLNLEADATVNREALEFNMDMETLTGTCVRKTTRTKLNTCALIHRKLCLNALSTGCLWAAGIRPWRCGMVSNVGNTKIENLMVESQYARRTS